MRENAGQATNQTAPSAVQLKHLNSTHYQNRPFSTMEPKSSESYVETMEQRPSKAVLNHSKNAFMQHETNNFLLLLSYNYTT